MMELADMQDLGSCAEMRWGSSPHTRTTTSGLTAFEKLQDHSFFYAASSQGGDMVACMHRHFQDWQGQHRWNLHRPTQL